MNSKIFNRFKMILLVITTLVAIPVFASESDINRTDAQGQRQGYWIIKGSMTSEPDYKPEEKVEEGTYKNNRKDGLWKNTGPEENSAVKSITSQGSLPESINYFTIMVNSKSTAFGLIQRIQGILNVFIKTETLSRYLYLQITANATGCRSTTMKTVSLLWR